jgi:hypothetical protein
MTIELREDTVVNSFLGYAEVVAAMIAAFGLAVALEWVGLYGLTGLMSERQNRNRRKA